MRKRYKLLLITLGCMLVVPFYYSLASNRSANVLDPGAPSQFTVPPSLLPLLQDYPKKLTRLSGIEPSGLHWNQGIVVYANTKGDVYRHNYMSYQKFLSYDEDEDDDANKVAFKTYAPGTILLKENYVTSSHPFVKPASVTVMMKQAKGYDPAMGDWRFVQFDTAGNITVDGSSQDSTVNLVCAFCHRSMVDRDYVFSTVYSTHEDEK